MAEGGHESSLVVVVVVGLETTSPRQPLDSYLTRPQIQSRSTRCGDTIRWNAARREGSPVIKGSGAVRACIVPARPNEWQVQVTSIHVEAAWAWNPEHVASAYGARPINQRLDNVGRRPEGVHASTEHWPFARWVATWRRPVMSPPHYPTCATWLSQDGRNSFQSRITSETDIARSFLGRGRGGTTTRAHWEPASGVCCT